MPQAVITVHVCRERRTYRMVVENEQAAVAFIERKSSTCAFDAEGDIPAEWAALTEALWPTCEHGMSRDSCYGPDHFMSAAQEAAMDWQYADAPSGF